MRINSLVLDNIRAIEHLELKALPGTGVIVIHGDNEEGKSTIMDALSLVLNVSHTSSKKDVKAIQPAHRDEAPEVTAALTIGPVELTIHKRWLRGKRAELTVSAPERANYTGADAENKLAEILGEHLDTALLETLFLRQDDLGSGIAAAGIPALQRALAAGQSETEDGAVDVSEDDGLMAAVEREYLRFFTNTGKENKALTNTRRDRELAAEKLAEADQKLRQLQAHVDQVDRHEQKKADAEADLPAAQQQVTEAQAALDTARQAEAAAELARGEFDRATHILTAAQQEATERAALEEEAAELAQAEEVLRTTLSEAEVKAAQEKERVEELASVLADTKTKRLEAAERVKRAHRTVRLLADVAARDQLQEQVERLDILEGNIAQVRSELAGLKVTDEDVAAVERARQDLEVAQRFRDLAIPYVELTADPEAQIAVDGTELELGSTPTSVKVREGTELTIGSVTARYRAGSGSDDTADEAVARAEEKLSSLLHELGCETVDEVRSRRDDAKTAAATLQRLNDEHRLLLSGQEAGDIRARATNLAAELDGIEIPELDHAVADAEVVAAETARDDMDQSVDRADAALAPWREGKAERELIKATANHDNAMERAQALATKLEAQKEAQPTPALAEAVANATTQVNEAEDKLRRATEAVAEADPTGKQEALSAAEARVHSLSARINQSDQELARLDGYIGQATGAAEELEKATARDEAMQRQLSNLERQAAAAQRLRAVLRRHRDEARARYAQPFVDELTKLARTVFGPEVAFDLTEDLTVRDRTIDGATVPLSSLSGGAKEQLAILTRFAIASLVAREAGDQELTVPVVVDDALGSTDPNRLQRMGQLFNQMGRTSQVIVLTCFPQRYDWVHPKTEYSITQLKSAR